MGPQVLHFASSVLYKMDNVMRGIVALTAVLILDPEDELTTEQLPRTYLPRGDHIPITESPIIHWAGPSEPVDTPFPDPD